MSLSCSRCRFCSCRVRSAVKPPQRAQSEGQGPVEENEGDSKQRSSAQSGNSSSDSLLCSARSQLSSPGSTTVWVAWWRSPAWCAAFSHHWRPAFPEITSLAAKWITTFSPVPAFPKIASFAASHHRIHLFNGVMPPSMHAAPREKPCCSIYAGLFHMFKFPHA